MRHVLTSEAVTRGHPDKLCDQVADGVLDALLTEDPEARAACEAAVWENHLLLFGEISARQEPDYEVVAREVLRDIGYDRPGLGLDADHCDIQIHFIRSHRILLRRQPPLGGGYRRRGSGDHDRLRLPGDPGADALTGHLGGGAGEAAGSHAALRRGALAAAGRQSSSQRGL